MLSVSSATASRPKMKKKTFGLIVFFVGLALVYLLVNIALDGRFLSALNLRTICAHAVFPAILAMGMSFIFSAGIIDLSIGSKVLLSANVGMILAYNFNLGYLGLFGGTIITCIILQLISSWLILSLQLPSWVAGLGAALVFESILAEYSTNRIQNSQTSVINITDDLRLFGTMPTMFITMLVCFVIVFILFNYTKIGINIRAIGSNADVAQAMGVDRKKTIILGAVVGAIFVGIASVVQVSYATKLEATTGLSSLSQTFNALACLLLSQSISRILNNIIGILVSSFVLMSVFNALTMFGVPSGTYQSIALGAIIILCGILANIGYKGVVK